MGTTTAALLKVTFFARPVESFRGDWVRCGDEFADPEIALDFVRYLQPQYGPTLVRSEVGGGTWDEIVATDGVWFCDDGARFGDNDFKMSGVAIGNLEGGASPGELVRKAAALGVAGSPMVLAACACARSVLHHAYRHAQAVPPALEVAEVWARGGSSWGALDEARTTVAGALDDVLEHVARSAPAVPTEAWVRAEQPQQHAIRAADYAVQAALALWYPASGTAAPAEVASLCERAAREAVLALGEPERWRESEKICLAARAHLSTLVMLRAARATGARL